MLTIYRESERIENKTTKTTRVSLEWQKFKTQMLLRIYSKYRETKLLLAQL